MSLETEELIKVRWHLKKRAKWLASQWIETELVGGSRRNRKRHEAEQSTKRMERQVEVEEILRTIDLPDSDLRWLLDNGWSPFDTE